MQFGALAVSKGTVGDNDADKLNRAVVEWRKQFDQSTGVHEFKIGVIGFSMKAMFHAGVEIVIFDSARSHRDSEAAVVPNGVLVKMEYCGMPRTPENEAFVSTTFKQVSESEAAAKYVETIQDRLNLISQVLIAIFDTKNPSDGSTLCGKYEDVEQMNPKQFTELLVAHAFLALRVAGGVQDRR